MKNAIRVTACLTLGLMMFALVGCGISKNDHEALQKKYTKVQQEMTDFNTQVKKVQTENTTLKSKMTTLEDQVKKLTSENKAVNAKYQRLLKQQAAAKQAAAKVQ